MNKDVTTKKQVLSMINSNPQIALLALKEMALERRQKSTLNFLKHDMPFIKSEAITAFYKLLNNLN